MSIIFGVRQSPGNHVEIEQMHALARATESHAPSGSLFRIHGRVGMGTQPIRTSARHGLEERPLLDDLGHMLCFDGRIDNHHELRIELGLQPEASDAALVLASFVSWGERCFSRLIGDWALGLWSEVEHRLYLARDHAGTRTLYYEESDDSIRWSTHLEALLGGDITSRILNPKYAAAYLGSLPIRELTPYSGIFTVPPARYIVFSEKAKSTVRHWAPEAPDSIRLGTDSDYEHRFRELFATAVARRTGPGDPVLAHLSGGMDSTSIVCMSDNLRRSEKGASCELLDTLSYYDDSEPNWNEKPYFSLVEAQRGKVGIHVPTSCEDTTFEPVPFSIASYPLPGADMSSFQREALLASLLQPRGYRAILTGHGGDELLGGVPTPFPELADNLMAGNIGLLLRKATTWCVEERKSLLSTLLETAAYTTRLYRPIEKMDSSMPAWLDPELKDLNSAYSRPLRSGVRFTKLAPSHIANGQLWSAVVETLPHLFPVATTRFEYRYPYLDRDLVDFLFRIPREQLVRPGRRRSLMRRALQGIVPTEVLERRRKAFLSRGPLAAIQSAQRYLHALFEDSMLEEHGWIDSKKLLDSLDRTIAGTTTFHRAALMRAIGLELWLQSRRTADPLVAVPSETIQNLLPNSGANKIRRASVAGDEAFTEIRKATKENDYALHTTYHP
jgi:asparagine synthase (glutamine-hydrolysing)